MTDWQPFNHESFEPVVDDPGLQNQMLPVLLEIKPLDGFRPTVSEHDRHLYAAWRTVDAVVAVRFVDFFVYRNGFPAPASARGELQWPADEPRLGLFYLPQSDLLAKSHETWVGAPLPLAESFELHHFAVAFGSSLLECLCYRVDYVVEQVGRSPERLIGELLEDQD